MGTGGGSSHRSSSPHVFGHMPRNLTAFRSFATQAQAAVWHEANHYSPAVWNAMSDAERHGIREYTGSAYDPMNTSLREGLRPSAGTQALIDGATAGLSRFRATEDMMTFRGAGLHWTANLLGGTEAQMSDPAFLRSRIGKTVVDRGFMSSGTHRSSAFGNEVQYTIFVH